MRCVCEAQIVTNTAQAAVQEALDKGGRVSFITNTFLALTNSLLIRTNLVLDGAGFDVTLSGNSTVRVFEVSSDVAFTVANLSIVDGRSTNGGGIFVPSGATVNLTNCILSGNQAFGPDGKSGRDGSGNDDGRNGTAGTSGIGGAIYNLGIVNITNSLISSNTASGGNGGDGGNGGNDSAFGGNGGDGANGAIGWGGGIYNGDGATLFIINSTLTNNFALGGFGGTPGNGGTAPFPGLPGKGGKGASGIGGAIYNLGLMTITNSTVVTNAALGGDSGHAGLDDNGHNGGVGYGGGIYNLGTGVVVNSTFTQNFVEGGKGGDVFLGNFITGGDGGSARGGAIFSSNLMQIVNCTLATNNATGGPAGINPLPDNSGDKGGSLGGNVYRLGGQLSLHNTILAKGTSGPNFSGNTGGIDAGYNLSSDASCSFNSTFHSRNNVNARLAPLAANSGPTPTMALQTNSPAIDAGDPNFCLLTDQRGVARSQGNGCDIGAFELVPTFSISGKIFEGTNGVSNIVVTAGGKSATSATNGTFSIGGLLASNYVVTPVVVGAGFNPVSTNIIVGTNAVNPSGNVTNVNFFANPVEASSSAITFISTNHALSNAVLSFEFAAMPQRRYKVQYSTNLSSTNWKNISTNISGTNGFFQFNQTNLAKEPQRFFRIVLP